MRGDGFLRSFCIWAAVGAICMTARQVLRDVPVPGAIMLGVGSGVLLGLIMAAAAAVSTGWIRKRPEMNLDTVIDALTDPRARPVVDVRECITLATAPDRALALCRATLRADGHCAGVRVDAAAATVRARGRLSRESVGERIECRVRPVEGGSQVELRSRPLLRTTLLDWGKNRENVDRIRTALEELVHQSGPPGVLADPRNELATFIDPADAGRPRTASPRADPRPHK